MLAATGLHKLPTHKGSGTSLFPPKPSSQAQIPSLHGLTYIVLADALHVHLSVSQSLEPYQMRQGASVRASRSSLMANGSRKYRASLLLGDPCQEANVKAHPSQASTSGLLEHSGHRTTPASQTQHTDLYTWTNPGISIVWLSWTPSWYPRYCSKSW